MPDLPINRTVSSTAAEHIADHTVLHHAFNTAVLGPFAVAHDTPGIDTGITLWTPHVGDAITGLWVEFLVGWSVDNEELGLGVAGTVDADLGYRFPLPTMTPVAHPTWVRGEGVGIPTLGSVTRLLTTAPIVARTVIGMNTTGSLNLWVTTINAEQL